MREQDHHELRMLLGAFALGDVTDAERAAVQAHLDGCAECRDELGELAPLAVRLAAVDVDRLDDVPPVPAELEDEVFARIAEARDRETPTGGRAAGMRRRLAAGAVAAAAAGIGFAVAWNVRPDPPAGPLEAVAVRALDRDVRDLAADVVPHTWGMEIKLRGEGFDPGAPYEVNVLTVGGEVVGAGAFIGTGPNAMNCNLNSSVLREDATGFEVVDAAGEVVVTSSF